jgi:hypothetical protein
MSFLCPEARRAMNEPEVVTETVMAPPVEAHANGASSPPESVPAPDAVSTTPPLPEMAPPAPPVAVLVPSAQVAPPAGEPLEERLRRLEAALTAFAEAKPTAPVARVVPETPARGASGVIRDSASRVMDAGRWLLPLALGGMRPTTEEAPADGKSPWFLIDALNELITYKYMYGDPRYRLTWTGRVMPLVLLALILAPWASLPMISLLPAILTYILTKLLDLFFAFLLFKVLNREARRYRAIIPQYPPVSPS